MLLRKRLAAILPPCTGCPLCGQQLPHIDRYDVRVEGAELIFTPLDLDPCPSKDRLQVHRQLTVEEYNAWSPLYMAQYYAEKKELYTPLGLLPEAATLHGDKHHEDAGTMDSMAPWRFSDERS